MGCGFESRRGIGIPRSSIGRAIPFSLVPRSITSGAPDQKWNAMAKLHVRNGTPVGNKHLCKRCSWSQIVNGYRESDLLVVCTNTNPNMVVPFTVFDCSEFSDKHKPTWEQMNKLAIEIEPTRASARTRGFHTITTVQPVRVDPNEDEDEDEAARVR
jgi:hypothetical protein